MHGQSIVTTSRRCWHTTCNLWEMPKLQLRHLLFGELSHPPILPMKPKRSAPALAPSRRRGTHQKVNCSRPGPREKRRHGKTKKAAAVPNPLSRTVPHSQLGLLYLLVSVLAKFDNNDVYIGYILFSIREFFRWWKRRRANALRSAKRRNPSRARSLISAGRPRRRRVSKKLVK